MFLLIGLGGVALTLVLVIAAGVRGHRLAAHVNRGGAEGASMTI